RRDVRRGAFGSNRRGAGGSPTRRAAEGTAPSPWPGRAVGLPPDLAGTALRAGAGRLPVLSCPLLQRKQRDRRRWGQRLRRADELSLPVPGPSVPDCTAEFAFVHVLRRDRQGRAGHRPRLPPTSDAPLQEGDPWLPDDPVDHADLAGPAGLEVDVRPSVQRRQLGSRACDPLLRDSTRLAGRPDLLLHRDPDRQHLARIPVQRRHRAGRPDIDPSRHPGLGAGRWRRLAADVALRHHAAYRPDPFHRPDLRRDLHSRRPDDRLSADQRWPLWHDRDPAHDLLPHRDPGRRPFSRGRRRAAAVPAAAGWDGVLPPAAVPQAGRLAMATAAPAQRAARARTAGPISWRKVRKRAILYLVLGFYFV